MRSYTLVETLAVTALLGLATALLIPALAAGAASSRLVTAAVGFTELDARARLLAQKEAGATIRREDRGAFCLRPAGRSETPDGCQWRAPAGIDVILLDDDGQPIDALRYNAAGRAPDFALTLRHGSTRREIRIAGLTGWSLPGPGSLP